MEKIKVKLKINDYIIEKEGIIKNDILIINNNEEIITFDIKKLILTKETKELSLSLDFMKKEVTYKIPEIDNKFSSKILNLSLTNKDKEYIINYQIEESNFSLNLKYETI